MIRAALLCLLFAPAAASAQQIFQWTDANGKTHYSSTPDHPGSTVKELPKLGRENLDAKIRDIKRETPESCDKHGGLDCSRGPDGDRSVICLDGYRGAVLPFQFACLESRLQADFSVVLDEKGPELLPHARNLVQKLQRRPVRGFHLNVRNLSGVAAEEIAVEFKLSRRNLLPAAGPARIDPFGSAEYLVTFDKLPEPPTLLQVEQADFEVHCRNCSAVIRSKAAAR